VCDMCYISVNVGSDTFVSYHLICQLMLCFCGFIFSSRILQFNDLEETKSYFKNFPLYHADSYD